MSEQLSGGGEVPNLASNQFLRVALGSSTAAATVDTGGASLKPTSAVTPKTPLSAPDLARFVAAVNRQLQDNAAVSISYWFRFKKVDEFEEEGEWSIAENLKVTSATGQQISVELDENTVIYMPSPNWEYADTRYKTLRDLSVFHRRATAPDLVIKGLEKTNPELTLAQSKNSTLSDNNPHPEDFDSLLPMLLSDQTSDRTTIRLLLSSFFGIRAEVHDRRATALEALLGWARTVDTSSPTIARMLALGRTLHHDLRIASLSFKSKQSEMSLNNALRNETTSDPLTKLAANLPVRRIETGRFSQRGGARGGASSQRAPHWSPVPRECRYCHNDHTGNWSDHPCPKYCGVCRTECDMQHHKCPGRRPPPPARR